MDKMTSLKHQNHGAKYSRPHSMAIFASSKIERAAQISELDRQPTDDDVWLKKMIKALADSEVNHDS